MLISAYMQIFLLIAILLDRMNPKNSRQLLAPPPLPVYALATIVSKDVLR